MKKEKELIVYKENILSKIKKLFKNLFKIRKRDEVVEKVFDTRQDNDLSINKSLANEVRQNNEDELIDNLKNENEIENTDLNEDTFEKRKEEIFRIYSNVKSGKCKLEDLAIHDLIKVIILLNQEKIILKQ